MAVVSVYELISKPHPGVYKLPRELVSMVDVASVGRKEEEWVCEVSDHVCPQGEGKGRRRIRGDALEEHVGRGVDVRECLHPCVYGPGGRCMTRNKSFLRL